MKRLVIQPVGGLCNRLRFLFSTIRYLIDKGKFKKTKLIVLWGATEHCNGYIQDYIKPMKTVIFKKNNADKQLKIDIRSFVGLFFESHKASERPDLTTLFFKILPFGKVKEVNSITDYIFGIYM